MAVSSTRVLRHPGLGCYVVASLAVTGAARAASERVLYSFKGTNGDGAGPAAGLIKVGGTLYGTTITGGVDNAGTVFSVTTVGAEKVLYSFKGPNNGDGANPSAVMLDVDGTLYGTTRNGGESQNEGTVFKVTKAGVETVLHYFDVSGNDDGAHPDASLTNVDGTLYGTTTYGANSAGTVFEITTAGVETVLYSFKAGNGDGAFPYAGLTNVRGTLYGTTSNGGANDGGTVFKVTTAGVEKVLYFFTGANGDGKTPLGGLIDVGGTLYGTTADGGANGWGTVFKITKAGVETVLYSFKGPNSGDGEYPQASLINVGGTLYGTTVYGGVCEDSCGTAFKVTTAGGETVVHSFTGGSTDGSDPEGSLIDVGGKLYGVTGEGGSGGDGTIFEITP